MNQAAQNLPMLICCLLRFTDFSNWIGSMDKLCKNYFYFFSGSISSLFICGFFFSCFYLFYFIFSLFFLSHMHLFSIGRDNEGREGQIKIPLRFSSALEQRNSYSLSLVLCIYFNCVLSLELNTLS